MNSSCPQLDNNYTTKTAIIYSNVCCKCSFHYFYFVFCYRPMARSKRWFVFFLADCRLISMQGISVQFPQWWSTMRVCRALQKQFSVCTLDNVRALLHMPKSHIWDWIKSVNLPVLACVWSVHSNTTLLCYMILYNRSCCSTQIFVGNYRCATPAVFHYACYYRKAAIKRGKKGHEKTLNLCWLSLFLCWVLLMTLCPAPAACLQHHAIDEMVLWCSDA